MKKKRRRFTKEFKLKAAARVKRGESAMQVAKSLGIHDSMVLKWSKGISLGDTYAKRKYSVEDKLQHAALARKIGAGEAAAQLGVSPAQLYRWMHGQVGKQGLKTRSEDTKNVGVDADVERRIKVAVTLLRGARGKVNIDDPIHLTAMLALQTLEGKL